MANISATLILVQCYFIVLVLPIGFFLLNVCLEVLKKLMPWQFLLLNTIVLNDAGDVFVQFA